MRVWQTTVWLVALLLVFLAPLGALAAQSLQPPVGAPISNALGGSFTAHPVPLNLAWAKEPPATIKVGQSFTCAVTATSPSREAGGQDYACVLYVLSIIIDGEAAREGDLTVMGDDGRALQYDPQGFFYWEPRTGFELKTDVYNQGITTVLTVTPRKVGDYVFTLWCVDLSEGQ